MPSGVLALSTTDPPRIGRYELLQPLRDVDGERHYLARISGETRNGQLFVVRVVPAAGADLAPALAHRVKAAASLRHQNVLGLLDAGTTDDGTYLVSRYVEGYPLAELQRRAPEMPARVALALAVDALHGLHALHATSDLVHGNVAPAALFVGTDGMCRIANLGDAELREGVVGYRAPEQIRGDSIDRRTDLFALGSVLWNALTGKTLYERDTDVVDRDPPRPSTVGLKPPAILDPVVLRALARDPERRFATADDMARTLRDLATRTACLAARTEIADWIASVCQGDIDARRRAICELALPPPPPPSQPLPTMPAVLPAARPSRRTPIVAAAAFGLALAAIAWRWVATPPPSVAPTLEIAVLDVTALADPSPPPPITIPAPPPAEPTVPAAGSTALSVTKPKPRVKPLRPAAVPKRPAITVPAATVSPAESPATKKPDQKAPPMESNPYVYK